MIVTAVINIPITNPATNILPLIELRYAVEILLFKLVDPCNNFKQDLLVTSLTATRQFLFIDIIFPATVKLGVFCDSIQDWK